MGTVSKFQRARLLNPDHARLNGQERVNAEIFTAMEILGRKLERSEAERDRLARRLALIPERAGRSAPSAAPGQRLRFWIAGLVALKRPSWLLDEPTSALDVASQARLAGLMRGHLAGGGMIIAATHGPVGLDHPRELQIGPA